MTTLAKHTAAGQALGYFFQLERALSWISKLPADSVVGIETEDDVAVTLLNGEKILEQDKSSTTSHPFIPSRIDIWKTLTIWQDAVKNGEIEVTSTTLYLVTNKVSSGSLAELLGNANEESEIELCIKTLKETAAKQVGKTKGFADKALSFGDEILSKVIHQIRYVEGTGLFGEELRKRLVSDLQLDVERTEENDSIINELIGWLFDKVTTAWRNKQPALVDRNAFIRQKIAIQTSYRTKVINEILIELGSIPSSKKTAEFKNNYVKQLQYIECDIDEIYKAIHDYLNAVAKRTKLAFDGYLTKSQFDELDRSLEARWTNIFKTIQLQYFEKESEAKGKLCYYQTLNCDTEIGGYKLNNHFLVNGSYHALANDLKIGWHPDYRGLMTSTKLGIPKMPKDLANE